MSISKNSQNLQLDTKRHSFAHIMAAAVGQMFPEAQFGVGPVIENGCYYDFVLPRTLIPEDLPLLENKIKEMLKQPLTFKVQEVELSDAILLFEKNNQPLKVELLNDLATRGTTSMSEEERADFENLSDLSKKEDYKIVKLTEDLVADYIDFKDKSWFETYPKPEAGITEEDIQKHLKRKTREEKIEKQKGYLNSSQSLVMVLTCDNKVVGSVGFGKTDEQNTLIEIYLLKSEQKKGWGRKLFNLAVANFDTDKDVFVEVAKYNKQAIGFYEKMGFEYDTDSSDDYRINQKSVQLINMILKKEKIVSFEQTNTVNNARTWQFNFYNQNANSPLDRIVRGTKTIETRALNPEEADRYFGDIKVGDKAIFHNKETGEDLEFVITKVNFYKNLADAVDKNLDFTKVGQIKTDYTTQDVINWYQTGLGEEYYQKIQQNGFVAFEFEKVEEKSGFSENIILQKTEVEDLDKLKSIFKSGVEAIFSTEFDQSLKEKFYLAEIENQAVGLNPENITNTNKLNSETTLFLTAKNQNNQIVGYAGLRLRDNHVYLEDLFVDENYRNKGYGKLILQNILKKYVKNGKLLSSVVKSNKKAVNFYQNFGFNIIEEKLGNFENVQYPYFKIKFDKHHSNRLINLPKITIYRLENEKTGEDLFVDLCKGPHIQEVKELRNIGFSLDKFSASYWRGDQARDIRMQRLYALVFDTKEELKEFEEKRKLAQERDHRKLGQELEIFMISETVGAGLPLYLPNGATIRQLLEKYCYQEAKKSGYQYVYTPHIGKSDLFAKSGHLDHYADGMYAPIDMVNLKGEGAEASGKTEKFYLKPMNCPMHHNIYLNTPKSYRDLPYRLYEYGTVYRYEESGTLSGMIRVRGFTQNDAHVYCQRNQLKEVIGEALNRFIKAYNDIGISEYKMRFSLPDFENDKEKYGDETEEWIEAVSAMRQVLDELGVDYYDAVGEAAFYGPKIDIQVKNVNGKEDSLSTIQVDYSIAPKFGITYKNALGEDEVPAIIHMALMGSVDRFMAFMLEMTGGHLPFWLAPTQVKILTINNEPETMDYVAKIRSILDETVLMKPLKYNEIRYEVDDRNESLGKKIREASKAKIPVQLIVGPKDISACEVSVRTQEGEEKVKVDKLNDFLQGLE
jgi:threonyl-tRNA synthetase